MLEMKGIGSPVIILGFLTRGQFTGVHCLPGWFKVSKQVQFSKIEYFDVVVSVQSSFSFV